MQIRKPFKCDKKWCFLPIQNTKEELYLKQQFFSKIESSFWIPKINTSSTKFPQNQK